MIQIGWVVDHLADLEADFLAIYHLDLNDDGLTGPRMFSLARRVFAYPGVMAARWEQEQQQGTQRAPNQPQRAPQEQIGSSDRVVDLAAFRANFPGLVSHTEIAASEGGENK